MKTKLYRHRKGGASYFDSRFGFSINESQFPNVHIHWGEFWGFYIAFSHRLKWHWFSKSKKKRTI